MPPEMITWVTPRAMMPMIETCRMMIDSRAVLKIEVAFSRVLKRNELPISSQPSASKTATISMSAKKTFSSGGRARFVRIEGQASDAMRGLSLRHTSISPATSLRKSRPSRSGNRAGAVRRQWPVAS